MSDDLAKDFKEIAAQHNREQDKQEQSKEKGSSDFSDILNIDLDQDLLLLALILFIFFQKKQDFSKCINFLDQDLKLCKEYIDIADSALQSLNRIIDLSDSLA